MQRRTSLTVAIFITKTTTSRYTECKRYSFLASNRPNTRNYVSIV